MPSLHRPERKLLSWTLVIAWCLIIYSLSNMPYSGEATAACLGSLNVPVRKLAHMIEYGILFALTRYALDSSTVGRPHPASVKGLRSGGWALIMSVLYAASDEWHQSFVDGRSACISDVLIDTLGAIAAWVVWSLYSRWRARTD